MTDLAAKDEGEGTRRVKRRNRRWWVLMLAPLVSMPFLHIVNRTFWPHGLMLNGALNPQFAIFGAVLGLISGLIFALVYHRIVDEQEERAALWGNTIGMYLLAFGGIAWFFLHAAKLVPLEGFLVVWLASGLVAAAVQIWLQFR